MCVMSPLRSHSQLNPGTYWDLSLNIDLQAIRGGKCENVENDQQFPTRQLPQVLQARDIQPQTGEEGCSYLVELRV